MASDHKFRIPSEVQATAQHFLNTTGYHYKATFDRYSLTDKLRDYYYNLCNYSSIAIRIGLDDNMSSGGARRFRVVKQNNDLLTIAGWPKKPGAVVPVFTTASVAELPQLMENIYYRGSSYGDTNFVPEFRESTQLVHIETGLPVTDTQL